MGILDEAREELRQSAAALKWEEPLVGFDLIGESQEQKIGWRILSTRSPKDRRSAKRFYKKLVTRDIRWRWSICSGRWGLANPKIKGFF